MRPRLWARLLFAGIGAAACLMAAVALETYYRSARTSSWLSHDETPVLLFFHHARNNTEERLRQANAGSGDVEVILTWNNLNDLDLHCVDPTGEEIFFSHKLSEKTGGSLDVDRNMAPPYTQQPVEHIFWPRGRAPSGPYRVYVHHYARHGSLDPTAFEVTVKEHGRVLHYPGMISYGYERPAGAPGMFVCEFTAGDRNAFLGLAQGFWRALAVMGAWAAVLAGVLAAALLAGLRLFYRRVYRQRWPASVRAARIVLVGGLWGAFAGMAAQAGFALLPAALADPTAPWSPARYVVGVALLAAIVGTALGGRVPHLGRGAAFVAGLLGGAAAGALFLSLYSGLGQSAAAESWARIAAAAVVGAAIGFAIALVIEDPEPPVEEVYEDEVVDGMQPLSLGANRMGPTGKLRRAGSEPAARR